MIDLPKDEKEYKKVKQNGTHSKLFLVMYIEVR
jgi:hypothetical protein